MESIAGLNNFSISSSSIYQQHNRNVVDGLSSLEFKPHDLEAPKEQATTSSQLPQDQAKRAEQYKSTHQYSSNPKLRAYQQVSHMASNSDEYAGVNVQI